MGYARISHEVLTSEKMNRLLDDPLGREAAFVWTAAVVISSRDLLDGRVPLRALRFACDDEKRFASLIASLVASGLCELDASTLVIVGYEKHNRMRSEVREKSEKCKASGMLGGKRNASRFASPLEKHDATHVEKRSSSHLISSASVSDLRSEIRDPDLSGDPGGGDPDDLGPGADGPVQAVTAEVQALAKRIRSTWRREFAARSDWEWQGLHDGPEFAKLGAWCVAQSARMECDPGQLADGVVLGFFATRAQKHWKPKWLNDGPERYAQAYADSLAERRSA